MGEASASLLAELQAQACINAPPCKWAAGEGSAELLTKAKEVGWRYMGCMRLLAMHRPEWRSQGSARWMAHTPLAPPGCIAHACCTTFLPPVLLRPSRRPAHQPNPSPQGVDREAAALMESAEFVSGPVQPRGLADLAAALDPARCAL